MPAKRSFTSIRVRGVAEFDGPLSGRGFQSLLDQASGATLGLHWVHVRDIDWSELQGNVAINAIDICILQNGTWLQDITFISSSDFNDAEATSGGIQQVGWGEWLGPEDGNGFGVAWPRPIATDGIDRWWQLNSTAFGLHFGHGESTILMNIAGPQTGAPVLVADQDAAGPLRCGTGGLSGDSTAGHIEVWLLIQGPDPLPVDSGGGGIETQPPPVR